MADVVEHSLHRGITDSKQLAMLDKIRVKPKLIRVASRFALLNRNVTTRTGTKTWPPRI